MLTHNDRLRCSGRELDSSSCHQRRSSSKTLNDTFLCATSIWIYHSQDVFSHESIMITGAVNKQSKCYRLASTGSTTPLSVPGSAVVITVASAKLNTTLFIYDCGMSAHLSSSVPRHSSPCVNTSRSAIESQTNDTNVTFAAIFRHYDQTAPNPR